MTHPDQSEQQLRRALGTMNDLQPPVDELFVQRAIVRGRARGHRRRNALVGSAAALAIVAGGGGVWLLQGGLQVPVSSTAGSAEGAAQQDAGTDVKADQNAPTYQAPLSPAMRDTGWFVGPMTPQRSAIESLAPELTTAWGSTFSGAWAKDVTNQRIVVALTHPDLDLERWISANVRDAPAVEFVTATHSYADKAALADRIWADAASLRSEGIDVVSVDQDFRADRVVVAAAGPDAAARLTSRYGADWVTVTVVPEAPAGTLPTSRP